MTDPSLAKLVMLERQTIFTPLGIRFWDAARGVAVTDGLLVTARAQGGPPGVATAYRTASGVYAFQGMPGLRTIEYPTGNAESIQSPPVLRRFSITVEDRLRRFVSVVFTVDAPYRGIFPIAPPSSMPGGGLPGFYLFSAPTRTPTPDLAMIRAELVDHANNDQPAAHAVLEVQALGGQTTYGIADARGCVAVAFPYPRFTNLGGSPLHGSSMSQRWPISLRVRYQPAALAVPLGASQPDLASIFDQLAGVIWLAESDTPVAQGAAELVFGQELIVRSDGESVLWIGSSASP